MRKKNTLSEKEAPILFAIYRLLPVEEKKIPVTKILLIHSLRFMKVYHTINRKATENAAKQVSSHLAAFIFYLTSNQ